MSYLIKPEGYKPLLDLKQTELGIKQIKEFFQLNLSSNSVCVVSPPLSLY